MAFDERNQVVANVQSLDQLQRELYAWCWVDFAQPTEDECKQLESYFHFHPLAIEDCYHRIQRPKLDHYDDVHFFVFQTIKPPTLEAQEINLFLTDNVIVSFHHQPSIEIDEAWRKVSEQHRLRAQGKIYAFYVIIDKIVDQFFPSVYQLEEQLHDIEDRGIEVSMDKLIDEIFDIRTKLLKIRKTIVPMRELLYRIMYSEKIPGLLDHQVYFRDVHNHLNKLSQIIDTNRELTADLRDSYVSINSYRMNNIMKTLTVITTIFMPLTFIAGIYGMNFVHMPELQQKYGYFIVLFMMVIIAIGMFQWFRIKKWFNS